LGANCQFTVPDYRNLAQVNKEGAAITQSPVAGTLISANTSITLTAKLGDETDTCVFQLTVSDTTNPVITCPGNQSETYNPSAGFTLPDYRNQATASDNCGVPSVTQTPAPGTVVNQNTKVTLKATDASGNLQECSFTVELSEDIVLDITCPSDQPGTLGANCQFTVPDYRNLAQVNKEGAAITQSPAAGTLISANTPITLTAKLGDETDTCVFQLTVSDTTDPVITCPGNQSETYNPSAGFTLPDYRNQAAASDNCGVPSVTQTPAPGTVVNQNTKVTLKATDASGNIHECSFTVELSEDIVLDITCPQDQPGTLGANCQFTVPDYRPLAKVNKEGATITQSPAAGTLISANTPITLTAKLGDETDTCVFQLTVSDTTDPVITCPGNQSETYNPSAGFTLPDYRNQAAASDNCGVPSITQTPAPGTVVNQNTQVTLKATDASGNIHECSFTVTTVSPPPNSAPVARDDAYTTGQDSPLNVLEANGVLKNDTDLDNDPLTATVVTPTANGTLILNPDGSFTYVPNPGYSGTDSFTYVANDGEEDSNTATVTITVTTVSPPPNSAPVAKDDFYEIQQDGILVVDAPGILGNDTDANGEALTAFVGSVSATGSFEFNRDGSFKYTPLPGFVGNESFTYVANNGSLNSNVATVTITVNGSSTSDFLCKDELILQLDASGNASLIAEDLYSGDPGDREFTLSTSSFDCSNIGSNAVTLTYTLNGESRSCEIDVEVEDNVPPVINAVEISIFLDASGRANITPQMLDNGTTDNCGNLTLSLNITSFACKDIGRNEVILTADDGNGNSASSTSVVTVLGNCGGQPPVGVDVEYIFIYPNPTSGPFTFATPRGVKINLVEAFDNRGRLIAAKNYPKDSSNYQMNLTGVESAVYMLKLFTTDGIKFIRVIIK
jgi:beta-lactam-binding protein with PASTA domain